MNRPLFSLSALLLCGGLAFAQQAPPVQQPEPAKPVSHDDHKRLSKKEKKELKKERDRERKDEKHQLKKEAEERKKQDKEEQKRIAKERKHDRDKENKELAKKRREEEKHERDEEAREANKAAEPSQPSMAGRAMGAATGLATAPFRIARYATPRLLSAQKNVSHAIYSALPTSNIAVLLNDAGQIVLRGSAPTPSLRARLLELALGAAGGYPIIDQLAANFVGDAASAATSAAISGVSGIIHRDSAGDSAPPPDVSSASAAAGSSQAYGPPSSPAATTPTGPPSALDAGNSACVNVSTTQVVLTGQATSQKSAEMLRQFARQLGAPGAAFNDQLATRSNGTVPSSAPSTPPDSGGTNSSDTSAELNASVTPGSTVCVNVNSSDGLMLTGTVGSSSEITTVERAAQPLVDGGRLDDQLTVGNIGTGTQAAANTGSGATAGTSSLSGSTGAVSSTDQSNADVSGVAAEESNLQLSLHAIPRLSNVDASVTSSSVRLTGTVDTTQDDQLARDIARQHAPGLSIVDNLSVAGQQPRP